MTSTEASSPERRQIRILGLPVDVVTMPESLDRIRGFLQGNKPCLVITADASGLVQAQTDTDLRDLYLGADLITPDSIGVIWAAKRSGAQLAGRVSGVEIVEHLCRESADKGWRIYFLGAAPGVAELAAERIRLKYPGCNIVGVRHGFFPADDDMLVAAEVAEAKPDILLVAMGIPRQEKFIRKTEGVIGAKVGIGVGGTFDVFSGRTKRAPKLFQRLHLEWFWRVLLNPSKISKVKNLPTFVMMVLRSKS